MNSKVPVLNDRKFDDTLNGIKKRLDQFYEYKSSEKSNKIGEHMDINALFQVHFCFYSVTQILEFGFETSKQQETSIPTSRGYKSQRS